jgi:hypothetical protein
MKHLFFAIILLLSIVACKDKAAIAAAEVAAEQARKDSLAHRLPPQVKKICLDTAWLRENGFTYQLLRTTNAMQWTISSSISVESLEHVTEASYIFTASSDTACSSLNMQLTTIAVDLGNRKQELQIPEYYIHNLTGLLSPDVMFEDYNFDGYTDLSVYSSGSGQSNIMRYYYLFDKTKKQFTFSPLISLPNAIFNQDEKTIATHWNGGHAARIGGSALYRFYNADSLLLLHETNQDFHDSLDAYIRIERKRLSDGTYSETIDTILRSEAE